MPAEYEAIRGQLKRKGMSDAEAKTHAAKIYNANRGTKPPVTGNEEKKKDGK